MSEDYYDNEPKPEYIKGFNQGYLLAEEKPELIEALAKAFEDNEHGEGFRDGCKAYLFEKLQSRKLDEKPVTPNNDKTITKAKDDKDMDRD